jgi:arylsulfatase A-like enzyme
LATGALAAKAGIQRPNILLIVSDDHGWGDLPANGAKTDVRMPMLDRMAREGVLFRQYHSAPLCGPARAGLLSGQYSMENGMWRGPGSSRPGDGNYRGIKYDVRLLPEILKAAGYATAMSGKWHLGTWPREVPTARGFDDFYGFLDGAHPYPLKANDPKFMHNTAQYCEEAHATDYITGKALKQIRAGVGQGKPFFQYVAYNAVHGPLYAKDSRERFSAKPEWLEKAGARGVSDPARQDYVATLEHMDDCIGRLFALLKELGQDRNTAVVFVSDNGAITMNDPTNSIYPGNNGPLRGGKGQVYQGGINVPCIMKFPGTFPAGTVSESPVANVDVFPTVLELAGLPVPAANGKNPVRGTSLVPHIRSGGLEKVPERSLFFELTGGVGMRHGNWKLVGRVEEQRGVYANTAKQLQAGELELYDLSKDIDESTDLRQKMPEQYERLKRETVAFFGGIDTIYPDVEATLKEIGTPEGKDPSGDGKGDKSQLSREERQQLRAAREAKNSSKKK